jgi:glycerophosphoryl diester phosphodiesterase
LVLFGCALTAWGLEPITPLEALHLVEAQVRQFAVEDVDFVANDEARVYRITGDIDGASAQAFVDADIARVLRIEADEDLLYEWPGIIAVGHRATVKFAPENTIAAIEKAIEHGVDLLELDIRQSKDGVFVVIHDSTVKRTTGARGRVDQMTLAELQALDAGSWFGDAFKGERIPTLSDALAAMKGRATPDIDFKAGDPAALVALLRGEGFDEPLTMYCGNWDLIHAVRKVDRRFLFRPTIPEYGEAGLSILIQEVDPPVVNINWPHVTRRMVQQVHLAGKLAFINTMGPSDNEAGIRLAIETGADYIQSDQIDVLMQVLREAGLHD